VNFDICLCNEFSIYLSRYYMVNCGYQYIEIEYFPLNVALTIRITLDADSQ
jgi:hypothetical protein